MEYAATAGLEILVEAVIEQRCLWCDRKLPKTHYTSSIYQQGFCRYSCKGEYYKRSKARAFWYGLRCNQKKIKI